MKNSYFIFFVLFNLQFVKSQTFLNGSFETTTSSGCNYNMANTTYNSFMSNSNAFGNYQALDIIVAGCYIPSVPNGTYAVSIANNPGNNALGEAFSLQLSSPLVSGSTYTISFKALALTSFGPQGNLLIGASTSNSTFGSGIYTANTVNTAWSTYTFTFVAPNNSSYITVMPVPGISSWNAVDNFTIVTSLPTELIDFSVNLVSNNNVLLEWSTASEINNDFFEIEHSINGIDWEIISKTNGAGNSTSIKSYRTIDSHSMSGMNYYRLKQTDFDGKVSLSMIKAIQIDYVARSTVKIFPNPTSRILTIEGNKTELDDFIIYTVLGEDITNNIKYNRTMESEILIDLSLLINGVYFIKTNTTTHKVYKY